jgi:hypothetical protein
MSDILIFRAFHIDIPVTNHKFSRLESFQPCHFYLFIYFALLVALQLACLYFRKV